jgi:hypothetical protein
MTWHYIKLGIKTAWNTTTFLGLGWFTAQCWNVQFHPEPLLNGIMLWILVGLVLVYVLGVIKNLIVWYYDMIKDRVANPIQQFGRYFYIFSNNGHKVSRGYTSYVAALDARAKMSKTSHE